MHRERQISLVLFRSGPGLCGLEAARVVQSLGQASDPSASGAVAFESRAGLAAQAHRMPSILALRAPEPARVIVDGPLEFISIAVSRVRALPTLIDRTRTSESLAALSLLEDGRVVSLFELSKGSTSGLDSVEEIAP